ncbi:MAG: AsmA family protein, partial [Gammaproteobacteria bacterium]
ALPICSPRDARWPRVFGLGADALPAMSLAARLEKHGARWQAQDLSLEVGASDLAGSVTVDTATRRFDARLTSQTLAPAALADALRGLAPATAPDAGARAAAPLRELPDGAFAWRIERLAVAGLHAPAVKIDGALAQGRLTLEPVRADFGSGSIRLAVAVESPASIPHGHLQLRVRDVDLDDVLTGTREVRLGDVSGDVDIRLAPAREQPAAASPGWLERLRIDDFRVRYDDPDLDARSDLRLALDALDAPVRIAGSLYLNDQRVDVKMTTDPLPRAWAEYAALPFAATLAMPHTRLRIRATMADLLPPATLVAQVRVEGENPALASDLLDVPLPDLPAYHLDVNVSREAGEDRDTWHLDALHGEIGDTDLRGRLEVMTGAARPRISGELTSRLLELDDVSGLVGATRAPQADTADKAGAGAAARGGRVLPDKALNLSALARLDLDLAYRARRIRAPALPLDDVSAQVRIDAGRLRVDDLRFGVADGSAVLELRVDAGQAPVRGEFTIAVDDVRLGEALAAFAVAEDSFGIVGGRAQFWVEGDSVTEWGNALDGGMYLTMTGGALDALLVEFAGLDFVESAALFVGSETEVPIDCAYVDLQARNGSIALDPILVETRDTRFRGSGAIELGRERIDITVHPLPHDFTLLSAAGPLHVGGTLGAPEFSVDASLPLPDFGLAAAGARCDGLVESLRAARHANQQR